MAMDASAGSGSGVSHADSRSGSPVPADAWEQPDMREALAAREVSAVYRLLRKHGVSQRQIAAMTGQSQSEVSEILKGRQVMAYDVLTRIADGLGVPRGYMGLAYDETTAIRVVGASDGRQAEEDESVKRRRFLAHAAQVTMGAAVFGPESGTWSEAPARTPAPGRIGTTDVRQVEAATRALRAAVPLPRTRRRLLIPEPAAGFDVFAAVRAHAGTAGVIPRNAAANASDRSVACSGAVRANSAARPRDRGERRERPACRIPWWPKSRTRRRPSPASRFSRPGRASRTASNPATGRRP
ncbi:hypothetical protein SSMG_07832 [Streptomyces sp. AA4]|nr:hypothetical protein SSMG_07832 [Streptomyces sp. AA4]